VLVSLTEPASPLWHLLVGYLVLSVGIGFVNPPITNGAVSGMPREQAGVASATASTSRQMGGVFGVALIGSIVFSELVARAHGLGVASGSFDLLHLPEAKQHVADLVFTSAIHTGYRVAAAFLVVGAIVAVFAMRRLQTSLTTTLLAGDGADPADEGRGRARARVAKIDDGSPRHRQPEDEPTRRTMRA
jgi:hypothetical protein